MGMPVILLVKFLGLDLLLNKVGVHFIYLYCCCFLEQPVFFILYLNFGTS
jgi:hypothetical protein